MKRIKTNIKKKMTPGFMKTHKYTSFKIAPNTNNTNEYMDTIVNALQSLKNNQMFKQLRDGQPVAALELFAEHKLSYYMMTVPTSHKELFRERFNSAFTGGGIKEHELQGWPFNAEDAKDTLITSLTLSKHPFFPMKMNEEMVCKDLLHLTENLKEDEQLFVQILIEPIDDGWQEDMERAYNLYIDGEHSGASGNILQSGGKMLDAKITEISQRFSEHKNTDKSRGHRSIKEVHSKLHQSGFHVAVRICVKADTYDRRNDILEGAAAAFKISNDYNSWQMAPVLFKKKMTTSLLHRKMPLLSGVNLMCEDELKVLLRFPTEDIVTRYLERMNPNEEDIDERLTKDIIPMGRSIEYGEQGKDIGFSISDDDTASKARLWIAPPGSGKSTAVKIFKNGAMAAGQGGSIFDVADGRLYYEAIESTPPEYRDKLVLVNFSDMEYPHIFNFDSLGVDADEVGNMFTEFFEVFFKTGHNHRMNSFLRKAAMTNFSSPDATFLELILLMKNDEYRSTFLKTIQSTHPDLFLWWKTEFPKLAKSETQLNEIIQPILYRLDNLQYNKRLGPIFCGKGGKIDIENWMNEGKWVLYNLSGGVFLENEQRMLMSFLNYAYWTATLRREKKLQQGIRLPIHHKMYDEPQTYMTATPIFELSISKSRKYRVSDNFLIQNPSQVIKQDESLWQQIIGMNPHIILGGGLDLKNLKIMAQEFGVDAYDLKQLEHLQYHWYMKTYVGKEAIKPFIFQSNGVPEIYGPDEKLERHWRSQLSEDRSVLQEDISARSYNMTVSEYHSLLESYQTMDDEEGVPIG